MLDTTPTMLGTALYTLGTTPPMVQAPVVNPKGQTTQAARIPERRSLVLGVAGCSGAAKGRGWDRSSTPCRPPS